MSNEKPDLPDEITRTGPITTTELGRLRHDLVNASNYLGAFAELFAEKVGGEAPDKVERARKGMKRIVAMVDALYSRQRREEHRAAWQVYAFPKGQKKPTTLRLHHVNRELVEQPNERLLPGVETLVVRDDMGRKLEVAALAWGPVAGEQRLWPVSGSPAPDADGDIVVSSAPLDARKTYLVIVVEHPDHVEIDE